VEKDRNGPDRNGSDRKVAYPFQHV